MRLRIGLILAGLAACALALAGPLPPGRQNRLSIEGQSTVTFIARAGLAPVHVDFNLKVEYIVDTRYGKETRPAAEKDRDKEKDDEAATDEATPRKAAPRKGSRAAKAKAKEPAAKVSGAIDLALHSLERVYRQDGRVVLETRASRARFQGRLQPEAPAFNVAAKDAPLPLQEILKNFDVVAASLLLDDDRKVVDRRYRVEGPQRAVIETLLSIHTPVPDDVDSWEAATQLAMGHNQTARGNLRFEKQKKGTGPSTDLVKVKVSGVLKAEGVLAGNFIKDGTYTVAGEQTFDTHHHEWTSAKWDVAVVNELANPAGVTVATAKGTMTVESRAVDGPNAAPATPKP